MGGSRPHGNEMKVLDQSLMGLGVVCQASLNGLSTQQGGCSAKMDISKLTGGKTSKLNGGGRVKSARNSKPGHPDIIAMGAKNLEPNQWNLPLPDG